MKPVSTSQRRILTCFFACTSASFEHITTWVLYRPPTNATGRIS